MITNLLVDFFTELEQNNNKEWFHANKKRYEAAKQEFLSLIEQLIPFLRQMEPKISTNPKDALFRINRDIRFSKDKTPYHTLFKAGFSAEGKKSQLPGFYLGMSANTIHLGGGLFNLDGEGVKQVRAYIANHTTEFIKIVENSGFKETFGALKGEQGKRLDKSLHQAWEKTPYVANKQFYAMEDLSLKEYMDSSKMLKVIQDRFEAIQPLNAYLNKAIL